MKQIFSAKWKASKQPRKQRKYRANAPLHIKGRFLHARLSKTLQKKYGIRSVRVIKGDKVIICRGESAGKKGEVDRVETKKERIFIQGIERPKLDGSKAFIPIHPSNVKIEEVNTKNKNRSFLKKYKEQKKEEAKPEAKKETPKQEKTQ